MDKNLPANSGTWFRALVWEDPTCCAATMSVHLNHQARALEPESCDYWAQGLQPLKAACLEPVLSSRRNCCSSELEKACTQQPRPSATKNKLKKKNTTKHYWTKFNNFYQTPAAFLTEIGNLFLKFIWECKASRIAKIILRKKNKVGPTLLNFKAYYKATVNKSGYNWHRSREQNWESRNKPFH